MPHVERLSFSIEKPLLERLEKLVAEGNYANRSEFIRDMVRDRLVEQEWERNEEALGSLTIVYDHHVRLLTEKLVSLQHDCHGSILVTTHVHLDHHRCVEVILVRGAAKEIRRLADLIRQQKGVLHAALSMSSAGHCLA
ncbi:MAG TPA: nickel-responsive transcriptional regulator NikR [Candidatus Hydrogenedentes bacterium]|nr:nickel-responsive transcriptional regulator NikR [Candidatus Hydrogenedentota bacterium]